MAVEMAASESPATIIEDGFDLAIHSGDLPDSALVARRFAQTMTILVATRNISRAMVHRNRPTISTAFRSVVFVERGAVQPWIFGTGQDAKHVIPTGVFRTSDIEQMRMGVLEHLGIAQAPAWLSQQNSEKGQSSVSDCLLMRTVPVLAYGLPAAGCPPKFAFSSSIWRDLRALFPVSIHDAETTGLQQTDR